MVFGYIFLENRKYTVAYRKIGKVKSAPVVGTHFCPGFKNIEAAATWFRIMYPNGQLQSKQDFEQTVINLETPTTKQKELNPMHMEGLDRLPNRKTPSGGFGSEFE